MPSLDMYRKLHGAKTIGETHKQQSDMIMNATWNNDVGSRIGYLYDYYHDLESYEKLKLRDLHPENDAQKIPIDIKFQQYSSQTYSKDITTFHIQLRPGQECNVPYFKEQYEDVYHSTFPVGLMIDIEDEAGRFNKWMIVGTANFWGTQYPTYEVLPCDYIFQYVYKGKKYQMAGCLRSQNSYNSGVWRSYRTEEPEDQQKLLLPMNRTSENIFYNMRSIIDNLGVQTELRAWRVSKVNRIGTNGIILITFAQDQFDEVHDFIEHEDPNDPNSLIIGAWCNYFTGDVIPTDADVPQLPTTRPVLSYKGRQDFTLKVGGNARTFICQFYDIDDNPVDYRDGEWKFLLDGEDAGDNVEVTTLPEDGNIKVKMKKDRSLVGKKCSIEFTSTDGISTHIDMNVAGL